MPDRVQIGVSEPAAGTALFLEALEPLGVAARRMKSVFVPPVSQEIPT